MNFRKLIVFGSLFHLLIGFAGFTHSADKLDKLVFSGPFSAVSYPLIHMMETSALADIAEEIEFIPVSNPDQARMIALGKGRQQVDFVAMPTNVAAIMYNKGVPLKLMNVSVWGILWIASRDENKTTLSDFRGEEIAIPYRADMPDIVFNQVAKAEGLDTKQDLTLRYTAHPLDAMQLLMLGQVNHALLAEPSISMALQKSQKMEKKKGAKPLYRSVDIQKEWGRLFKRPAAIPQLGMTASKSVLDKPKVLRRFNEEYERSAQWCLNNPKKAGELIAKHLDRLTPMAISNSLQWTKLDFRDAKKSTPDLEDFYKGLMADRPVLIGGKLPNKDFYYQE